MFAADNNKQYLIILLNHLAMLSYKKLMALNPTVYTTITNSIGQEIKLVEHPLRGDEAQIIAVSDYHQLAQYTGFYDTADMLDESKEYEPSFIDGKLYIGEFSAD